MKIIHSYWTLPAIRNRYNRFSGIWLNKKYNFISWMLSALQFLQFYEKVELITDDYGKALLGGFAEPHVVFDFIRRTSSLRSNRRQIERRQAVRLP